MVREGVRMCERVRVCKVLGCVRVCEGARALGSEGVRVCELEDKRCEGVMDTNKCKEV